MLHWRPAGDDKTHLGHINKRCQGQATNETLSLSMEEINRCVAGVMAKLVDVASYGVAFDQHPELRGDFGITVLKPRASSLLCR